MTADQYRRQAEIFARLAEIMGAETAAHFREKAAEYTQLADVEEANKLAAWSLEPS